MVDKEENRKRFKKFFPQKDFDSFWKKNIDKAMDRVKKFESVRKNKEKEILTEISIFFTLGLRTR